MPDQEDPSHEGENPARSEPNDAPEASSPERESSSSEGNGVVTVRLETIANILTAAVAIAAILLSVWEGVENRRHNRLSVLPNLTGAERSIGVISPITNDGFPFLQGADSLYAISYALENTGLGPAVIENFLVFEGEEKIFDAVQADSAYQKRGVRRGLRQLPFGTGFLNESYGPGDMLKSGEVHGFMSVSISLSADTSVTEGPRWLPNLVQDEVLEKRSYVFCYCSVYGSDCDQTHLGGAPPQADVCEF